MKNVVQNFLITVFGLVTSVLTAAVLVVVENLTSIPLYSFMLWFLVPVGALFSGLFAASGYLMGARLLHRRPTKPLLVHILLVSTVTFFLVYYLKYRTSTDIIGEPASDFISFWQYLHLSFTNLSLSPCFHFRCTSQGLSLGWLGYGIGLLQIVGFSMGGLGAYASLRVARYCEHCNRYYALKGTQERYYSDLGAAARDYATIVELLEHRQYQEAVDQHAMMGSDKRQDSLVKLVLKVQYCSHCRRQHMRLSTYRKNRSESWREAQENVTEADTAPDWDIDMHTSS